MLGMMKVFQAQCRVFCFSHVLLSTLSILDSAPRKYTSKLSLARTSSGSRCVPEQIPCQQACMSTALHELVDTLCTASEGTRGLIGSVATLDTLPADRISLEEICSRDEAPDDLKPKDAVQRGTFGGGSACDEQQS